MNCEICGCDDAVATLGDVLGVVCCTNCQPDVMCDLGVIDDGINGFIPAPRGSVPEDDY